jgi:hypothetical protein
VYDPRLAGVLVVVLAVVGAAQNGASKPKVSPYPTDGVTVGFLVTATNGTGADLMVISYIRQCQARIDGEIVHVPITGGSGGGRTIPPGGTWRELNRLVTGQTPAGGWRLRNPDPQNIAVKLPLAVTLRPGEHVIAFNCGRDWSDDIAFAWK